MTNQEKKEQIIKIFKETKYIDNWFDYEYYIEDAINDKDISVFDDGIDNLLCDYLIIYNHKAMDFLMEEDPSLKEAFDYAKELGYTLDNLDSEKLANLVLEARIKDEWHEIRDDIENILEDDTDDEDEE